MPRKKASQEEQARALRLVVLCAAVTLVVMAAEFFVPWTRGPVTDANNYVNDLFTRVGRYSPYNTNLVLIGINQPSYDDVILPEEATHDPVLAALRERFPWSRNVWAAAITRLGDAGAKVIAIDLVFAAQSEGDDELRAALDKYKDQVVIGANFSIADTDRGEPAKYVPPSGDLIPDLPDHPAALDPRVGYIQIFPDDDDVLRRSRYRMTNHEFGDAINTGPNTVVDSFDALVLKKMGAGAKLPPVSSRQKIRFTGPPGTWPVISLSDVLTPKIWEHNFGSGKFFAGKTVIIGPTANIFQDFHRTPFREEMPGPEAHVQLINAALQGEYISDFPPLVTAALIALAGLLGAYLCQFIRLPLQRIVIILTVCAAVFVLGFFGFVLPSVFAYIVGPMAVLVLIGAIAVLNDWWLERKRREELRRTMGMYFSPKVLEVVLADPGSMQPRRAEVVLLLTDLRNSTPLAEALGPKGMFELLNRVFEAQTNTIMGEEGNLEHFLGDQFLSYWGAPQKQPDAGERAARAAQKLIAAMEELRGTLSPEVHKLFGYGVALHAGNVLIGNKGSALRLDYGLVGDTVNEAARVEALTKYYGAKLLVTREAMAKAEEKRRHRLVDRVIVKGKSEPVELFECENPCTPANYPDICERYKAAFDEYHFGRFAEAQKRFEALVTEFHDGPSKALAARCAELLEHPPEKWNGVWKMEAK